MRKFQNPTILREATKKVFKPVLIAAVQSGKAGLSGKLVFQSNLKEVMAADSSRVTKPEGPQNGG